MISTPCVTATSLQPPQLRLGQRSHERTHVREHHGRHRTRTFACLQGRRDRAEPSLMRLWSHPVPATFLVPFVASKPFGVLDFDGERRPQRTSMTNASDEREFINFETLAWSSAITQPATSHFLLDFLNGEFKTRRQPLRVRQRELVHEIHRRSTSGARLEATRSAGRVLLLPLIASRRIWGKACPRLTLKDRLVDQHSEPVNRLRPSNRRRRKQSCSERVVDDVGYDMVEAMSSTGNGTSPASASEPMPTDVVFTIMFAAATASGRLSATTG